MVLKIVYWATTIMANDWAVAHSSRALNHPAGYQILAQRSRLHDLLHFSNLYSQGFGIRKPELTRGEVRGRHHNLP